MGIKSVDTCSFGFDSLPDWCKTQEIRDKVFSKSSFMLK